MLAGRDLFVIVVVASVVIALATRPRNLPEWVSASIAAAAILLGGAVHPSDVPRIVHDLADVLLFLSSMLVISHLAAEAGVFAAASLKVVAWSRGSGIRLFILLYLLGAMLAIVHRAGLPPLPYLVLCPFAANIPSLSLPISNLTNLIVVDGLHIHLVTYASMMALPAFIATLISLWALVVNVRAKIPAEVDHLIACARPLDRAGRANAIGLLLVLAGLFAVGLADWPLWWVTVPAAGVFIGLGAVAGTFRPTPAIVAASPGLLVFVIAMGIVVEAASGFLLAHIFIDPDTSPALAVVAGSGVAAIVSNIVNNVPVALGTVAIATTLPVPLDRALGYGALVGANIGPALTTYGSLATLIWLTTIRSAGYDLRPLAYMRIAVLVVLPTLVATTAVLALAIWLTT